MTKKRPYRLWLLSTLNALLMLLVSFYWLSLPYTFGDEAFMIKWTALTKKSLLGIDPKPAPESVLFVDIAESKTTIRKQNAFGELSDYHRTVITDRQHLGELLQMMVPYRDDIQLVVLDVLLDLPTAQDSFFQAQVSQMGSKILGVNRLGKDQQLDTSVIHFNQQALATYRSAQGLFLKYPLVLQDSLHTVPLAMYELIDRQPLRQYGWFYRFPAGISLPAPVVDFKVRSSDFKVGHDLAESNFSTFKMGTLLESRDFMAPEDIADFFRGKIVMVGDFENDIHDTPFGKSPGLLLIYNAYLTLAGRENLVSAFWVIFLFGGYWLISWRVFNDIEIKGPRWFLRIFNSRVGRWLLDLLDDAALLVIITIISYYIFNIHINILILLLYIKTVEFVWEKVVPYFLAKPTTPDEEE